jgi:hypothetical protein
VPRSATVWATKSSQAIEQIVEKNTVSRLQQPLRFNREKLFGSADISQMPHYSIDKRKSATRGTS